MSTLDILTALQNSSIARLVTKSNHLVIAGLQLLHVFGILLLFASLALVSLRVLGLVLTQRSLPEVVRQPERLFWIGLSLAVASGTLIFLSGTIHYYYNRAFDLKMILLLVAVVGQFLWFRRIGSGEAPRAALARTAVALSLAFWIGVGAAARAIAFI